LHRLHAHVGAHLGERDRHVVAKVDQIDQFLAQAIDFLPRVFLIALHPLPVRLERLVDLLGGIRRPGIVPHTQLPAALPMASRLVLGPRGDRGGEPADDS